MQIQRTYSKAKAAGNHVVWTNDQIIPAPYILSGLVNQDSFAFLRVAGSAMVCRGFHAHFRVPAGDRDTQISIVLATAQNVVLPHTRLALNGVTFGGDKTFVPAVPMPVGSLWKINVEVTYGDPEFQPEDLTVTYQLQYANGQARSNTYAYGELPTGVGFFDVDGNFIVS